MVNRSIKVLRVWYISLVAHFVLVFILKGWNNWSDFCISLASLKWVQSFKRWKKFLGTVSRCFWLYCFGVGTTLKFSFKSMQVFKEKYCFDKFKIFPNGSDLYSSMFLIFCCILIEFACWLSKSHLFLCWFLLDPLIWKPNVHFLASVFFLRFHCYLECCFYCLSCCISFFSCSICLSFEVNIWLVFELLLDGVLPCLYCSPVVVNFPGIFYGSFATFVTGIVWDDVFVVLYIVCSWYSICIWSVQYSWLFSLLQCFPSGCP